jgi:hypothetical protein
MLYEMNTFCREHRLGGFELSDLCVGSIADPIIMNGFLDSHCYPLIIKVTGASIVLTAHSPYLFESL